MLKVVKFLWKPRYSFYDFLAILAVASTLYVHGLVAAFILCLGLSIIAVLVKNNIDEGL